MLFRRFHLTLLVCNTLLFGLASGAQTSSKEAQATPPPSTHAPETAHTAEETVEVGDLDGVPYRIDLPNNWNRQLIVFYHGYSENPLHYKATSGPEAWMHPSIRKGYAVVQSAYGQIGWALDSAFNDTEKLRKYFVKKYGTPKETYVAGGSMGGALTVMTIERNPKPYIGGLNMCGAVGSTLQHATRRFALRAAFDFYFPGLMPPLVPVPANYIETEALRQKVLAALNAKPPAAEIMRNLTQLHTNPEVARMMVYFTYFVGDMQRKAGANPFDNRDTIYAATSADSKNDYALNDGVTRYAADPKARAYLLRFYEPTGRVMRPIVALHTVYDPLIPANLLTNYHLTLQKAGFSQNYVQQYVKREGHCTMTPEEVTKAFDELVGWVHGGHPPQAGLLH